VSKRHAIPRRAVAPVVRSAFLSIGQLLRKKTRAENDRRRENDHSTRV